MRSAFRYREVEQEFLVSPCFTLFALRSRVFYSDPPLHGNRTSNYRAMDLRALFTEMCDGRSKKGFSDSRSGKGTKESLSSSRLARGLKHAGLPLDRALVNLLVGAFSTSGGGRHHSALSYADFHRMVHCDGLLAGGSAMLGAGGGGPAGTLDEQVRGRRNDERKAREKGDA